MRKISLLILLLVLISFASAKYFLTVYNDNLALVKDTRKLELLKGVTDLSFTDVASGIDPTSVHFRCIDRPSAVTILEQNYEYDIVSTDRLLSKFIDKEVSIFTKDNQSTNGKLMSSDGGSIVLKTGAGLSAFGTDQIVKLDFPTMPQGLITRPTLVWKVDSDFDGSANCELSYLTSGISWEAGYVATSNKDDSKIILDGWVTINNQSGAAYTDAELKLVAGDVNIVKPPEPVMYGRAQKAMTAEMANDAMAPQFEEQSFFEYHLYTLSRPATVGENQIKQLSLFPPAEVPTKKVYYYDTSKDQNKIRVTLEFNNKKDDGLGIALPKGKVRVYKQDSDGALQFVGEDQIDHTPKDEKVRLFVGNAFDVTVKRERMDYARTADNAYDETYKVVIKNHKDTSIDVVVVDHFWGDWYIKKSSIEPAKKNANNVEFSVPVKSDGETELTYMVHYKY